MIRLINLPKVESEIIACFRFKWDEIPNDVKLKIEFRLLIFSKKNISEYEFHHKVL